MECKLNAIIMVALTVCLAVVDSYYVCILKKRPDPSSGGVMRWSLLYDEICHCQRVYAPKDISRQLCAPTYDEWDSSLWFVDNPKPLTKLKQAIDKLLNRTGFCGAANKTDEGSTVDVSTNDIATIKPQQNRVATTAGDQATDKESSAPPTPPDCYNIFLSGNNRSDIYDIYPLGVRVSSPVRVFCDMRTDGGGWTVIQRREDASVDFYRGWEDYKNGFGNITENFWLGNELILRLTNQKAYELRIDMEDFENETRYALYGYFKIGDEQSNYTLSVNNYEGTAGDSLKYHNTKPFTTKDRDNDNWTGKCAGSSKGAWWYKNCIDSNLNGLYLGGVNDKKNKGIIWTKWKGRLYSLKRVEMKIRPSVN